MFIKYKIGFKNGIIFWYNCINNQRFKALDNIIQFNSIQYKPNHSF